MLSKARVAPTESYACARRVATQTGAYRNRDTAQYTSSAPMT
jgi:hypothetical protein